MRAADPQVVPGRAGQELDGPIGFKDGGHSDRVAVLLGGRCVFWYELNISPAYMHDEPLSNTIGSFPADMVLVLRMARTATEGWRTIRSAQGKPYTWSSGTLCHDFTEFMAATHGHQGVLDQRGQLRGPWSSTGVGRNLGRGASGVLRSAGGSHQRSTAASAASRPRRPAATAAR
ncbi:MAG: hypothetical protein R3B06_30855 [Kofleriaceae bacterium]